LITIVGAISAAWILFASGTMLSILAEDSRSTMAAGHQHASAIPWRSGMPDSSQQNFYLEMTQVNARMHESMQIVPSGDPDRDFTRMMIPHHQGAIDMAVVELRYGKDERLRRLAQEINVAQQQEIAVMHLALGDALPPGSPAPTQISPHPHVDREH
jgi:uncharacterized protein (DUF305 family)